MVEEGTEDPVAAAVLDANTSFYSAFSNGDIDLMTDLWADDHPVSLAHCRRWLSPLLTFAAPRPLSSAAFAACLLPAAPD